jgi:hypothetical protein
MECGVAGLEEIATRGHVSQGPPCIHVSGEVGGGEESTRVHHPPLDCSHYLQAAVLVPLSFPRDLPLDEGRAFLLASECKSLPFLAGVDFAVDFFVDFFLDFFVDFDFGINLGVVVATSNCFPHPY